MNYFHLKTHINTVKKIIDLNQLIKHNFQDLLERVGSNHHLNHLVKSNREISHIINNIKTCSAKKKTFWIDKYFEFLCREIGYDIENAAFDSIHLKNIKLRKQATTSRYNVENNIFPLINNSHNYFREIRNTYDDINDSAVILTAIPIEFISVIRRFSIITNISNIISVSNIIDPNIPLDDKENRKDIWIEGVIFRYNRYIKIKVILAKRYGQNAALNALNNIYKNHPQRETIGNYIPNNEIILVGIAGQLDINENVKIGDLVISSGFYNTNVNKAVEKTVSLSDGTSVIQDSLIFKDKNMYAIQEESEYIFSNFNYKTWSQKYRLIQRPLITNNEKQSDNTSVYFGPFVTGPTVIKQNTRKAILRENFPKALAVEMEANGAFSYAENNYIKLKIIKSVVDFSDGRKNDEWHSFGADLAAEFAVDYLIAKYGQKII